MDSFNTLFLRLACLGSFDIKNETLDGDSGLRVALALSWFTACPTLQAVTFRDERRTEGIRDERRERTIYRHLS
jgi:hypothetical protein